MTATPRPWPENGQNSNGTLYTVPSPQDGGVFEFYFNKRFIHKAVNSYDALMMVLQEIWDSIPSSCDEDDPTVRRHAAALNGIPALLQTEEYDLCCTDIQ